MNIKQAKEKFTIEEVLLRMGHQPEPGSRGDDLWFKSPFRNEEKASFHLNHRGDVYYDHGDTEGGGDLIKFVCTYLKSQGKGHSVSAALQFLENLGGDLRVQPFKRKAQKATSQTAKSEAPYKILSNKEIFSEPLIRYLEQKAIPLLLPKRYFRQIYFLNRKSGKKLFGLGFETQAGSFDIRMANGFKTMIGDKDITIINGDQSGDTVNIFEGATDFLSVLAIEECNQPEFDCIVLNSVNLYEKAALMIREKGYQNIKLWLDNDRAGRECQKVFLSELNDIDPKISVFEMNAIYDGFKDLNQWHCESGLSLNHKKNVLL